MIDLIKLKTRVEVTHAGRYFRATRYGSTAKENLGNNVRATGSLVAQSVDDHVRRHYKYASSSRVQKVARHPLARALIAICCGSHEKKRDERLREAQEAAGIKVEEGMVGDASRLYGAAMQIKISFLLGSPTDGFEYRLDTDVEEETVQTLKCELGARATTMTLQEATARELVIVVDQVLNLPVPDPEAEPMRCSPGSWR